jgi:hypothetical protein
MMEPRPPQSDCPPQDDCCPPQARAAHRRVGLGQRVYGALMRQREPPKATWSPGRTVTGVERTAKERQPTRPGLHAQLKRRKLEPWPYETGGYAWMNGRQDGFHRHRREGRRVVFRGQRLLSAARTRSGRKRLTAGNTGNRGSDREYVPRGARRWDQSARGGGRHQLCAGPWCPGGPRHSGRGVGLLNRSCHIASPRGRESVERYTGTLAEQVSLAPPTPDTSHWTKRAAPELEPQLERR